MLASAATGQQAPSPTSAVIARAQAPRAEEVLRADVYAMAEQLSREFVDALFDVRALSLHKSAVNAQTRARDDDDGGDSDDTSKLISQVVSAFRPIVKSFANVVSAVLPAGPQQQLVKAAAGAVDSLLPLILKYALGI
ncbi:hypothetical protein GGI02_004042 [Coemansia sp. RSA 2322]|uniref:Uncharacterized protein n=1 Tax=Coemansia thaxteri TaxID=2663907 RepID=A0A9W8B8I3_9FUNG|nr:hypothetical protein H4R26_005548 [Coemansia thaxteri]KAJ2466076.1 hypothetical protein EV174_006573 [Coemansia sp. RSA 2320]KAJ2467414.1 hypothetical protein GGI02_004042 [Coemansia sp. RSA 2322]